MQTIRYAKTRVVRHNLWASKDARIRDVRVRWEFGQNHNIEVRNSGVIRL